jgi:hypothetical protein
MWVWRGWAVVLLLVVLNADVHVAVIAGAHSSSQGGVGAGDGHLLLATTTPPPSGGDVNTYRPRAPRIPSTSGGDERRAGWGSERRRDADGLSYGSGSGSSGNASEEAQA